MIRNLKATGLSALAVLVMSAIAASAAHAEAGAVEADEYPATLTGEQTETNVLSTGGGVRKMSCQNANFHGHLTGPAATVTITPAYSNCKSEPGGPATVTMNGCDYTLSPTKVTATTGMSTGFLDCPAGQEAKVHIYENATKHGEGVTLCEYGFAAQGPLAAGEYHNEGEGNTADITATLNVTGITTKSYKNAKILCGASPGTHTTSSLSGAVTLTAENENGEQIGVKVG